MSAAAAQAELFPVLEEKVKKRSPLWAYLKATAEHGPLAPPMMIAASMGVSKQRVYQFISEGRLECVRVNGKMMVPVHKFEEFLLVARRQGQASEFHAAESYREFLKRCKAA